MKGKEPHRARMLPERKPKTLKITGLPFFQLGQVELGCGQYVAVLATPNQDAVRDSAASMVHTFLYAVAFSPPIFEVRSRLYR